MQKAIARWILLVAVFSSTYRLPALDKEPASDYHARRVALAAKLGGGVALMFGAKEPEMEYESWRQDEDFYYLTGWNEPGAVLVIEAASAPDPYREILFLPVLNPRFEKYKGEQLDPTNPEAGRIAGFEGVRPVTELITELVRILTPSTATSTSPRPTHLAIKPSDVNAKNTLELVGLALNAQLPPPHDLTAMTAEQRMTKSAGELALLKRAAEASVEAQKALFKAIEPGVSERTIEGLIDYKLKANGCERPAYPSIVGSGANSTVLHYEGGDRIMKAGDLVVIDAAGEYSMYASDITRTLPVSGHFTARQREIYDIVLGAQQAVIASFVSGKSYMGDRTDRKDPNSLNKIAFDYVNTHGKDLHNGSLGQYWIHGLGHSVGIDVHDPYDYSKPFGPGAVFTIEPGIYIPDERIGVRIEDTFYVDSTGKLISLTGALPRTADDVEAAMKR
jgi:Xaa-Pro aminopeptidase